MTRKTVALLIGGWSAEREVSLEKGRAVETALKDAGYAVRTIDVKKDLPALIDALTPRPDVVFNNLYGQGGEDGTVRAVLDMLEIPCTHSGVLASAIAMDKPMTRRIAQGVGVRVAQGVVVPREEAGQRDVLPRPYVIKPTNQGSSVGVCIIRDGDTRPAMTSAEEAAIFGNEVLVESYIPGRELTVAVLDGKAQAVTEIVSHTGFFDYESKYHDTTTQYILPAPIPEDCYRAAMDAAEKIYAAIGCSGLARCDFRFDDTKGAEGICLLEVNTQPGLTEQSIGPSQVIRNGMTFPQLCAHLVETATCHGVDSVKSSCSADYADHRRLHA